MRESLLTTCCTPSSLPTARRELRAWLNPPELVSLDPQGDLSSALPTPTLSDDSGSGAGSGFFSGRIRRKSGDWASAGFGMDPPTPPAVPTSAASDGQGSAQPIRRKSEEWSRRTLLLGDELAMPGPTAASTSVAGVAARRGVSFRRDEQAPHPPPATDADNDAGLEGIEVWETSASTSKGALALVDAILDLAACLPLLTRLACFLLRHRAPVPAHHSPAHRPRRSAGARTPPPGARERRARRRRRAGAREGRGLCWKARRGVRL